MNPNEKVTVATFRKRKAAGEKISMITVYDAPSAAICHSAGVDALLVGDSLAMTVLGYKNTLPYTMEEALHHTKAVRRGAPDAFVIFDMPFMSYQTCDEEALRNAGRAIKEAGADAVKLEGGAAVSPLIEKLVGCGIPVLAHIGLLPQHIMAMAISTSVKRYLIVCGRLTCDTRIIVEPVYGDGIDGLLILAPDQVDLARPQRKLPDDVGITFRQVLRIAEGALGRIIFVRKDR